jgi:hypothetical protein
MTRQRRRAAGGAEGWAEAVWLLHRLNRGLRCALRGFPPQRLDERLVPEAPYTSYTQLIGLPQHDLYHAGQMVVLRRALLARPRA